MKIKCFFFILVVIYFNNTYSQQVDTLELEIRNVWKYKKNSLFIPCPDMCNCISKTNIIKDTLEVLYEIDSIRIHNNSLAIYSYGLKNKKFKICIPTFENFDKTKINYLHLYAFNYRYLFVKKGEKYVLKFVNKVKIR